MKRNIAVALLPLVAGNAAAQTSVHFGALTTLTGIGDLDLSGNFAYAIDVGGPGRTVGGLTFAPDRETAASSANQNNPGTQASPATPGFYPCMNYPQRGGNDPNLGDENLDELLQYCRNDSADFRVIQLDVTPGARYKLQVLALSTSNNDRRFDLAVGPDPGATNADAAWKASHLAVDSLMEQTPKLWTYEFTATAGSLWINCGQEDPQTGTDPNPCLSAITLEYLYTAGVRVFVEEADGKAWIKDECVAGGVVQAFALDVSVDRGHFTGISDFFTGTCGVAGQGYGIFPAAFRDHITVSTAGTVADWSVSGYDPLAVVADAPADTLPGLGSSGVTLEFGALWDAALPATAPPASGTLCALQLSQDAMLHGTQVTVAANTSRGGVVASPYGNVITPTFAGVYLAGSYVGPPRILDFAVVDGVVRILFEGGELESALDLDGNWTGTGNTSGTHAEVLEAVKAKFFRVHQHDPP